MSSSLYQWDNEKQKFSVLPVQYLPTEGARCVSTVKVSPNMTLVVIGNYYNSVSRTYELK